jgi:hypothetical protein
MAQRPGGRIPPDGRPTTAPQVGANARRHDLERPKTPGLHNSDLQQGDVQALEAGQRIVPVPQQQPAVSTGTQGRPTAQAAAPAPQGAGGGRPDPIDFLGSRLSGTLTPPDQTVSSAPTVDLKTWLPLIQRLATAPGASGVLSQAFITQMRNASQRTFVHETPLIDMQEADRDLEALMGA